MSCPKSGYEASYEAQCEQCEIILRSNELINPPSFLSGQKPKPNKKIKALVYIWFDAPIGYISFTKEILNDKYKDW